MSQSDYIRHKRLSYELSTSNQKKMSPILNAGKYTEYKEYSLENAIVNTTIDYNELVPPNAQIVFGIQYNKIENCPIFILCQGTNMRPNRKPSSMGFAVNPIRPLIKKQTILNLTDYCTCK